VSAGMVIVLSGVLVASACALLGAFLVLRRMAMMADAISHAILPGLVAAYFLAQGPNLLAGFLGAAAAAVVTVSLVEGLQRTGRLGEQSAIGLVFPAMFALGTFLVSKYFASVHLDTDAVLFGNIEFAAHDTLIVGGRALGPLALWLMGTLCALNAALVAAFYKELKLATFDAGLAAALGFSPALVHYLLMSAVSMTAVGAFTAVGAVLAVSLFIVPPATAYLLTDRLPTMLWLSVAVGAASAVGGYLVAAWLDASIAGAMATMAGVAFALAVAFSPSHGVVARVRRLQRQRLEFAAETLVVHLATHAEGADAVEESAVAHLSEGLRWTPEFAQRVVRWADRAGLVRQTNGHLSLTPAGARRARETAGAREMRRG
jgi:manganese/zinc/iron transport system permease protein